MKPGKKTFLWEVSINNAIPPSYLFGSMHIVFEPIYAFWAPLLKDCIDSCEVFATEYDLRDGMKEIESHLRIPGNQHLRELVSLKSYNKARKIILKSFGLDLEQLGYLRPMVITNMLAEIVLSATSCVKMDQELFEYAQERDKIIIGLESKEITEKIFEQLSIDQEVIDLIKMTRNVKGFRKKILKLANYYQNSEVAQMHKSAKKSLGKFRKVILYDRNLYMSKRMLSNAQEKSIFGVVGAGHLFGGKGMLKILKDGGAKITPIVKPHFESKTL